MNWIIPIPDLREKYTFVDSHGRGIYSAIPQKLLTTEDAKEIPIKIPTVDFDGKTSLTELSLFEKWEESKLFSPDKYIPFVKM